MAARKLSMFEKMANNAGVLFRYHYYHYPRRWAILRQAAVKELAPPMRAEWPKVKADFKLMTDFMQSKAWKNWTVRETLVYSAVAFEVLAWFIVGEMIGRRCIHGYVVPASYVHPATAKKAKKMRENGELDEPYGAVHH